MQLLRSRLARVIAALATFGAMAATLGASVKWGG